MKKSLLSIVLSIALVMTAFGAMFVMPASAANGMDFLAASIGAQEGVTAEIVDGALVINATAAGQEVALTVEGEANLNDFPFWEATIDSEIPFDVALYDPNNAKWMFAAGDFCYNFNGNQGASQPIRAGQEDVKFSLTGAYTWTGSPLPANAAVKSITFIAKAAGKMTISKCAMTDGMEDVPLFPENVYDDNWNQFDNLVDADRVNDWVGSAPDKGGDSEIVVSYDEENSAMNFGNTNGNWPSASIKVDKTVDYATSAIDLDLTVLAGAQTTMYVFFGNSDPDNFIGEGDDTNVFTVFGADVSAGNYHGIVKLSDLVPANSPLIGADGKITVSYVKLFATSGGTIMNPAVVVNHMDLCYSDANPAPENAGDIDLDGDIDAFDALIVLNAAYSKLSLTEEEYDRADWDRDYDVDEMDAFLIFSKASGIPVEDLQ